MSGKAVSEIKDGIAFIKLNSPDNFNAMSEELLLDLDAELIKAADDSSVRVIVIFGEGRAFCAGGDIREMKKGIDANDDRAIIKIVRRTGDVARRIRSIGKPIIASVHGSAAGAGVSLALLCDFRVVSEEVKFIEAFINLGFVPDMAGIFILSRYVGLGRATELVMTGRPLDAKTALEWGVVNSVVPREKLGEETQALAEKLIALPAAAHAKQKAIINRALFTDMMNVMELEEIYQNELAQTADYREGVNAFLEKRKPQFGKTN